MPAWFWVMFWWLAFAGSHLVLSSIPVRRAIIGRVGDRGFAGVYSLVALATFVPLTWAFWGGRHSGPLLWMLGGVPGMWHLSIALSCLGFALMAASFVQPSPFLMGAEASQARGLTRITRHPLFAGVGVWGLAHILMNGFLTDVLFFGGFAAFFVVGCAHQDARKRHLEGSELRAFFAETSLLPFAAILGGRNRLHLGEIPWLPALAGVVVAVVLYALHPFLFVG